MAEQSGGTRRLPVDGKGAAPCPMCGTPGEATSLFRDVFLCVADGCRVWTFEAERVEARPREPAT